jgi:hypothetical protein
MNNNVLAIITLVCGLLWLIHGLISNTKNIQSAIVYKIIPVLSGVASIFVSCVLFGILKF